MNRYSGIKQLKHQETKQFVFVCEPGSCSCVPEIFGGGGATTYNTINDCINDNNCCNRWKCDPQGSGLCEPINDANAPFATEQDCLNVNPNGCQVDYYDCTVATGNQCAVVNYTTSHTTLTSCQGQFPNGCAPVDYYDCTQATGYQCAIVNYSTPHTSLISCQTQNPNGCTPIVQQTCCDVWVCVGSGTNSECCKSLQLCKPVGGNWGDNYPNGFPWQLVESSNVPPQEFNRILKENLLLEWMCNMDWSVHFGIWLGATKQECLDGPSWSGVGPASGQGGCGPCLATPYIPQDFIADYSDDEAIDMINQWKEEGKVKKLDESFYTEIVQLVEEVYHTQKLLKG